MAKRTRADVHYAIDLLWGHQIQRENVVLRKQFQQLQIRLDQCQNDHGKLLDAAERAQATAGQASSVVESLAGRIGKNESDTREGLELARGASQRTDKIASDIQCAASEHQALAEQVFERLEAAETKLNHLQEQAICEIGNATINQEQASRTDGSKVHGATISALASKFEVLEKLLAGSRDCQELRGLVPRSIKERGRQSSKVDAHPDSVHKSMHPAEDAEEEEHMLTLQDMQVRAQSTTPEESIDLDQNVAIPSCARHAHPCPRTTDSLQPITLERIEIPVESKEIDTLRQGRYHSWERYLAEGQNLLERLPKESETFVVRKFIDGLYSAGDRQQCKQWLDHNGWKWEHVLSYGLSSTPSVPLHAPGSETNNQPGKTSIHKNPGTIDPFQGRNEETAIQVNSTGTIRPVGMASLATGESKRVQLDGLSRVTVEESLRRHQRESDLLPSGGSGVDVSTAPQRVNARTDNHGHPEQTRSSRASGTIPYCEAKNRCQSTPDTSPGKSELRRSQRIAGSRAMSIDLPDASKSHREQVSRIPLKSLSTPTVDRSRSTEGTTAARSKAVEASPQRAQATPTHHPSENSDRHGRLPPSHQPAPRKPHSAAAVASTPPRRRTPTPIQMAPPLPSIPPSLPLNAKSPTSGYSQKRCRSSHSSVLSFLGETSSIGNNDAHLDSSDGPELPPLPSPSTAAQHTPLNIVRKLVRSGLGANVKTNYTKFHAFRKSMSEPGPEGEGQQRQKRRKVNDGRRRGYGQGKQSNRRRLPPPEIQILPTSDFDE